MLFCLLLFCLNFHPAADSLTAVYGLGVDIVKPMHSFDFSDDIFAGFDLCWKFSRIFGASFNFYYIKKQYYDYADGWYGPDAFANINTGTVTANDWIFYHTETVMALNLLLCLPLGDFQPYFATGPAWLIISESEAALYYPEFAEYFENYKNNSRSFIGYLARFGFEVFIFDFFTLGTEFLFKVDKLGQFFDDLTTAPLSYIQDRSHFVLTLRFWLGQEGEEK